MPSNQADVIVIGLGAMGSAVLYQLARGGARVLGIDRFSPPHPYGSSHGETRITRLGVGEGGSYAPLVRNSHRIWRDLEAETGETLFTACGALVMASSRGTTSHHGTPDFVGRSIAVAKEFGVPHEVLDGVEIGRRFTQFLNLSGDARAYFEPGGGYLRPELCIAAQLRRASDLGAQIRRETEVVALEQDATGVTVRTPSGNIRAPRVIVAAGAWSASLLKAPFDALLTVTRQTLHWYRLDDLSAYPPDAPVFIWMHGATDVDYLYGFPPMAGERRLKLATEQYATATAANAVDRTVTPAESAEMYRRHVAGRLAGVTAHAAQAAACLYTTTPDRGFIIDRHPDMDRVHVVSACSGHGFKHSAGIGESVAEMMIQGRSSVDLSPFALARLQ